MAVMNRPNRSRAERVAFMLRLDRPQYEALREAADRASVSRQEMVRQALRRELGTRPSVCGRLRTPAKRVVSKGVRPGVTR